MLSTFLGFTFLLAAMFPIAPQLLQLAGVGMYGGAFKDVPPFVFHVFTIVVTYAPAAIVTAWFLKTTHLSTRLPSPAPGIGMMNLGVALTVLYLAARLFASTIEGGGASFVVVQMAAFVLWPARILLTIAAVRVLLAARAP